MALSLTAFLCVSCEKLPTTAARVPAVLGQPGVIVLPASTNPPPASASLVATRPAPHPTAPMASPEATPAPPVPLAVLAPSVSKTGLTPPTSLILPQTGWQSLARWSETHDLGRPIPSREGTNLVYTLHHGANSLEFTVGRQPIRWDGTEVWLASAPHVIEGETMIQTEDADKTLEPLLADARLDLSSNRTIVIDPGHGGPNRGAKSVLGEQCEADFTLDWARRLQPLLESQGWRVYLTRTNDSEMSLADRVSFAEQHQAGAFISLHFNSALSGEPAGLETYCLTPVGLASTLVRELAEDIHQRYPNNGFDEANLRLALRVHRALVRQTGEPDHGLRHARFMGVLRWQNRPAVLVEGGYLSNPREAELIANGAYRQRLAEGVAAALGEPLRASQ